MYARSSTCAADRPSLGPELQILLMNGGCTKEQPFFDYLLLPRVHITRHPSARVAHIATSVTRNFLPHVRSTTFSEFLLQISIGDISYAFIVGYLSLWISWRCFAQATPIQPVVVVFLLLQFLQADLPLVGYFKLPFMVTQFLTKEPSLNGLGQPFDPFSIVFMFWLRCAG